MKPDLELQQWCEQWQSQSEVPADLRRKVERSSRNMRIMLAVELLITVVIGGWSLVWAVREPRLEMYILAIAVWLFLAAAWRSSVATRRGLWRPWAVSTADFVELSIRRCNGRLAAARFGVGLYFTEMVFCLAWLYRDPARRQPWPAVIYGVATPLFLLAVARYRRNTREELERLQEYARGDS